MARAQGKYGPRTVRRKVFEVMVEAIPEAITDGHLNAYGWELWRSALRSEAVTLWFASPAPSPAREPLDPHLLAQAMHATPWHQHGSYEDDDDTAHDIADAYARLSDNPEADR